MESSSEDVTKWIASMQSLSRIFLNNIGRTYLDEPLDTESSALQLASPDVGLPSFNPRFLKIDQVGEPVAGLMNDPFTSLQTILSACHNPRQHRLLFLVINDGKTNELYLGISRHDFAASHFVENLGAFLQSNWHGVRYSVKDIDDLHLPPLDHGVALTGMPSLKPGDYHGYPQSLDRILRGLQGSPFAYLVIADPMSSQEVLDIIDRCRDWIGRFHSLVKTTHSGTITLSANVNTSVGKSTSDSFSAGLGHYSPLSANYTFATGESFSFSEGVGSSVAQTLGKEYVNSHAQAVIKLLEQYTARFEHARASGCWNVGIYFLAARQEEVIDGAIRLRSLLSGETSAFEPIRIHDLRFVWKKGVEKQLKSLEKPHFVPVKLHSSTDEGHPLGKAFNELTTPLNTEELALVVNLPRREIPGVHVIPVADFSLNPSPPQEGGVVLGTVLQGGEPTALTYSLPVAALAKHTLVTGISGSGKSTTCRHLLNELLERGIPFLVIEPAKDEYISWAMQVNRERQTANKESIAIYVPGLKAWHGKPLESELALNPFEVIRPDPTYNPNILSHIDRLKSILVATFPMQEVLPLLLEDVLFHAYTHPNNWLAEALPAYKTPFPTLSQLADQIPLVVRAKGYEERITSNLTAALTTRIQNLRRGWKRTLFDQQISTPYQNLFEHPTIINLSYLGDDADKAFAMAILLQFLYEYRQLQHELVPSSNTSLQHLTIIEEAHRILQRPLLTSTEFANPQAKMAEMFAHNLAELRAYGQGFMIVDQVPAKLIPDAIKNTNLKIVHRLVAGDDREAIAQSMSLTEGQTKVINRLHPGQAIVYGDLDDMASWIYVSPKKA